MGEVPAGPNSISVEGRFLTRAEFHRLADVPPEAEWFANLDNPNTRRAYRNDVGVTHLIDVVLFSFLRSQGFLPYYQPATVIGFQIATL